MNYYILFPSAAFIINTFVWSYVFGQRLQDRVSRLFLLCSAAAGGWILGDFLLLSPLAFGHEMLIARIQSVFWIPTGFLFLNFSYAIAGKKSDLVVYVSGALCVVGILVFALTDWTLEGILRTRWGSAVRVGVVPTWIYASFNIGLALYALFVLAEKRRRTNDREARGILNLLLSGGTVATISVTLLNLVVPDVIGILSIPRLGSTTMVFFIFIVFIAVTQYHFLVISVEKVAEELFNEIEDGIFLIDRFGQVKRTNRFAHLLLTDPIAGFILKDRFGDLLNLSSDTEDIVETKLGGENRILSISVSDAAYGAATVGKIVVVRDITEQRYAGAVLKSSRDALKKEVEQRVLELRHAQKMEAIGTLADGIAHDFNNILAAISGFTHAALQSLPPVHPIRSDLNEVMIASRRAREIVQQILTFSRPKDRSMYQLVVIRDIIDEALELLRIALPAGIRIETCYTELSGAVSCDPNQLSQVLLNLGTNAFQSMVDRTGGVLRIVADRIVVRGEQEGEDLPLFPGEYLRIQFLDNGCGMSEEVLSHIFDPFFSTRRAGEGSGLGLSTALEIVKNHDGAITVESTPGAGSCFTVLLPALEEADDLFLPAPEQTPGGTEHIMVVDDEKPLQRLARRLLEPLGYRVTTFSNGPDALTYFGTGLDPVDLVITDQTMPEMTGIQLAAHLLARSPDLPIILMSGYGVAVSETDVLAAGIRRFLKKPVPSRRFPLEIRSLLDGSERASHRRD